MKSDTVDALARAVLYEGYLLYPYRRTALKNRQRWNFGVLFPPAFCSQQESSEASLAQTECLFEGTPEANLEVTVRFLQQCDSGNTIEREILSGTLRLADLLERAVLFPICFERNPVDDFETTRSIPPLPSLSPSDGERDRVNTPRTSNARGDPEPPLTRPSDTLSPRRGEGSVFRVMERTPRPFDAHGAPEPEGSPANSEGPQIPLLLISGGFELAGGFLEGVRARGDLPDASSVKGCVEVMVTPAANGIFKLQVRILNQSPFLGGDRDKALESAFISVHALLAVQHGCFHSLIDPPEAQREMAADCRNIGMWPVLVGSERTSDQMLSCAIILYDNPKISAASSGDFFDATEIDELLALRVRTLSEVEKEEVRNGPPAIRAMLEHNDELNEEDLCRLHPSMQIKNTAACPYRQGDRVRLRPKGRADIFDLALAGKTASIISIEQDFEGQFYLCVIVEEDPGKDLGLEGKPGHRFFFRTDEVERL